MHSAVYWEHNVWNTHETGAGGADIGSSVEKAITLAKISIFSQVLLQNMYIPNTFPVCSSKQKPTKECIYLIHLPNSMDYIKTQGNNYIEIKCVVSIFILCVLTSNAKPHMATYKEKG